MATLTTQPKAKKATWNNITKIGKHISEVWTGTFNEQVMSDIYEYNGEYFMKTPPTWTVKGKFYKLSDQDEDYYRYCGKI